MNRRTIHMVELTLKTLIFPKVGEALAKFQCPDCDSHLELHQPEAGFPDRMLGTCHQCHRWFVADFRAGHDEGVIVFLPDSKFFLRQSQVD
jgi:hypothetical protein